MAGIGFELRRLVETRTLRGALGAAFSGVLVVAGPWLVSAASLAAANRLPILASPEASLGFTGAMVWALALSICLSAAPLYVFVRLSADLVYEGKKGEAATLLLKFSGATCLVSLPGGYLIASILLPGGGGAVFFRLAFALLLTSANVLWATMMTATVMRKHGRILGAYGLGMALMYFLASALGPGGGGPGLGAAGVIFALASGYGLTAALLIWATVDALGTAPFPRSFAKLWSYFLDYRNLALAGLLYAASTWIDKGVLALWQGVAAKDTLFFVNPGYDGAFYIANLALIPGLVFFTISTETEFSLDIKRLIGFLGSRRLPEIESAMRRAIQSTALSLGRQSAFQGAVAIAVFVLAPWIAGSIGFEESVFARLLVGIFFQLILLTGLTMLFYLELYWDAALSAFAFFAVNLTFSLLACLSGQATALEGLPFASACFIGALFSVALGFRGLARFDRIVLLRASGERFGR